MKSTPASARARIWAAVRSNGSSSWSTSRTGFPYVLLPSTTSLIVVDTFWICSWFPAATAASSSPDSHWTLPFSTPITSSTAKILERTVSRPGRSSGRALKRARTSAVAFWAWAT